MDKMDFAINFLRNLKGQMKPPPFVFPYLEKLKEMRWEKPVLWDAGDQSYARFTGQDAAGRVVNITVESTAGMVTLPPEIAAEFSRHFPQVTPGISKVPQ